MSLLVARLKLEPESEVKSRVKFESGFNFYFSFISLLLMSSGYYSLLYNDVLVVNVKKKKNFQVCNVFR